MAEDVHRRAKEIGTVCSVTYPLPIEELKQHGMGNSFLFALGGRIRSTCSVGYSVLCQRSTSHSLQFTVYTYTSHLGCAI